MVAIQNCFSLVLDLAHGLFLVLMGGSTWRSVPGMEIRFIGADPGAVKLEDGSWLITYTSMGNNQPRP